MSRCNESANRDRRHFLKLSAASAALWLPNWTRADDEAARVATRSDTSTGDTQKLGAVIKLAKEAQETLKKIKDYEATFSKKELVGKKLISSEMFVKFREQPFSVYLKYLNPHAGREIIYVADKNKGRLLAHGEGVAAIIGTLKLKPDSKDAMEENRYPITMFGLSNLLITLLQQWDAEQKQDDAVVKFFPNAKLDKVACKVAESKYPTKVPHAKFHLTRLFIAKDSGLPVRVEQFGFPTAGQQPPVLEEYHYSNIKTNVGLSDIDFDAANKAYGF